MSSERRLHPLSIVFESGRVLRGLLLPLVVLLFATMNDDGGSVVILTIIAAISALVGVGGIIRFMRFTYRYDERDLVIRSGLFTRKERRIPYVRIQNLDAAQNPLHRLLRVAGVYVQTGGGAEPEASLSVLPLSALEEMRARVLASGGRADAADGPAEAPSAAPAGLAQPRRTLLVLNPRDLIVAGFIENRGMVLIFGALALLEQSGATSNFFERLFESDNAVMSGLAARWPGAANVPAAQGALIVIAAVLTILFFIRILSTIWAVVRLYGFRLERVGDDLHTEYGLFTRVSATIPLRRIQTVIIRERLLHRWLGRRSVMVETAGGQMANTGAPQREAIAPILSVEHLPALLHELHAGLDLSEVLWQPVHRRAFGRMLRGSLFWPLVLSATAWVVIDEWAIAILVALLTMAVVHARLRSRYIGWSLTRDSIVVRDGSLTRTTRVARFNRIQVAAMDRSPIDMRTGMASVRADTAGARSGLVVPFLPDDSAVQLHGEIVVRAAATEFTW